MNANQKKMIDKLEKDNKQLNDVHNAWKDHAKVLMVAGILVVVALIIIYAIN